MRTSSATVRAGPDRAHRRRGSALGLLAAAVLLACAGVAGSSARGGWRQLARRDTVSPLDALPVLLRVALVAALLWATLLLVLAARTLARARIGCAADGTGPRALRGPDAPGGLVGRLAAALLAATAIASVAPTASAFAQPTPVATTRAPAPTAGAPAADPAARGGSEPPRTPAPSCAPAIPAPGWTPRRPAPTGQRARDCAPLIAGHAVPDVSHEVVVRRGDTLWAIAARTLGPHADARRIAAEWPRWYAANRAAIGSDPDLLIAGTRLRSPGPHLEGSNR